MKFIFNIIYKKDKKISKKRIFYIIFFISLLSYIFYISGLIGVFTTILEIIIYSLLSYLFYYIWKNITKKEFLDYNNFFDYFLYRVSILILSLIIIFGSFTYYKNEISPAPMPTYTISNGKKIVIFQAMSHIGSQNFYNKIKENLIQKKKEGFVYYYEGVKNGTQKNIDDFNKALGIEFDKDLYKNLSKLYGVIYQDNSIYYNLVNMKDYNVDITIDEIMNLYNKDPSSEKNNILQNEEVVDINSEIIETLSSLNKKELNILRYINKAILNTLFTSEKAQGLITNNFGNKKLFDIILYKRNDILSNKIIKSNDKKIFITYGLLHFKGVLELLQKNDKNWKIIETKYLFPIK